MSAVPHTPTPWRVFKSRDGTKLVGIGGKDGVGILDAGFGVWAWDDPEGIANAEMVVRAVNSHDALVKALEAATDRLQTFLDTFGDLGDCVTQSDIDDWRSVLQNNGKDAS